MIISAGIFFFHFFEIFIFWAVRGLKGKGIAQNERNRGEGGGGKRAKNSPK